MSLSEAMQHVAETGHSMQTIRDGSAAQGMLLHQCSACPAFYVEEFDGTTERLEVSTRDGKTSDPLHRRSGT